MKAISAMIDENNRHPAPSPIEMVLREGRNVEMAATVLLLRNDGSEIPIVQSAAPIRARSGEIIGVVLVLHDVSNERQYAAKLSYQASHDSLTGLINRAEFEHRMSIALKSAAQMGRHHAVMYLDLDQFKVSRTASSAVASSMRRQHSDAAGLSEGENWKAGRRCVRLCWRMLTGQCAAKRDSAKTVRIPYHWEIALSASG